MKKGLLLSIIIMMLACLALPALAAKASTPGNQGVSHPEEIEDGAERHATNIMTSFPQLSRNT